jgi:hypothetical protein
MAENNINVVSEEYIHKSGIYKRNFISVEFVSRRRTKNWLVGIWTFLEIKKLKAINLILVTKILFFIRSTYEGLPLSTTYSY